MRVCSVNALLRRTLEMSSSGRLFAKAVSSTPARRGMLPRTTSVCPSVPMRPTRTLPFLTSGLAAATRLPVMPHARPAPTADCKKRRRSGDAISFLPSSKNDFAPHVTSPCTNRSRCEKGHSLLPSATSRHKSAGWSTTGRELASDCASVYCCPEVGALCRVHCDAPRDATPRSCLAGLTASMRIAQARWFVCVAAGQRDMISVKWSYRRRGRSGWSQNNFQLCCPFTRPSPTRDEGTWRSHFSAIPKVDVPAVVPGIRGARGSAFAVAVQESSERKARCRCQAGKILPAYRYERLSRTPCNVRDVSSHGT